MTILSKYPATQLNSGIWVVNYSSPHPYNFHTGEILPACSDKVAIKDKLDSEHQKIHNPKGWYDIDIKYILTKEQQLMLKRIVGIGMVDIVLVPYPVMNCIKELKYNLNGNCSTTTTKNLIKDKIRVCKLDDRVTKVIRSDEFCI